MAQFTADDLKPHLSIEEDVDEHDILIDGYIASAEDWVKNHVRRDLDAEYPDGWPPAVLQAVRYLVANFFAMRESAAIGAPVQETDVLRDMLASFRDLGA